MTSDSVKRNQLELRLAKAWVQAHRADVWQEIRDEAARRYPLKKPGRPAKATVDALARLPQ